MIELSDLVDVAGDLLILSDRLYDYMNVIELSDLET